MKVYLVEFGCYADRWIAGVYATPEAAMAANPPPREGIEGDFKKGQCERPGGWRQVEPGHWSNGLDWADHAVIDEFEVEA